MRKILWKFPIVVMVGAFLSSCDSNSGASNGVQGGSIRVVSKNNNKNTSLQEKDSDNFLLLTNPFNSQYIGGRLIYQVRPVGGMIRPSHEKPGLHMANLKDDGSIDLTTDQWLYDSAKNAGYEYPQDLFSSEFDQATVSGNAIYYIQNVKNGHGSIYKYDSLCSNNGCSEEGKATPVQSWTLPQAGTTYSGLSVLESANKIKFVTLSMIEDQLAKICLVASDDDMHGSILRERSCKSEAGDSSFKTLVFGTDFKMRPVPGTNYVALFKTYHLSNERDAIHYSLYKIDTDKDKVEFIFDDQINIPVDSKYAIRTRLQMTDIQYVEYKGYPGFAVATHFTGVNGTPTFSNLQNDLYFFELTSSDNSGTNLSFKDGSRGSIFDQVVPKNGGDGKATRDNTVLRIIYPYSIFVNSNQYKTNLEVLTGLWNGINGYFGETYISKQIKESEPSYYIQTPGRNEFSLFRFFPRGVVFGAPPRYDDGKLLYLASNFTYKAVHSQIDTDEGSNLNTWSFSVSPTWSPISPSIAYSGAKKDTTSKTVRFQNSDSMGLNSQSYGPSSAWVVGNILPYDNGVFNYASYSPDGQKLAIKNFNTGTYIPYPAMNLAVAIIGTDKAQATNITFDITKPENILDKFAGSDTWSALAKGLPKFPAMDDIKAYAENHQAENWAKQAAIDNYKYYSVKKTLILTNSTDVKDYSISAENFHSYEMTNSVTGELKTFSTKTTYAHTWMSSRKVTISSDTIWSFGYLPIDYSKMGKERFSIYAYLFIPQPGVDAKNLPWSSDLMKQNNIQTWAVAYNIVPGVGKKQNASEPE